MTKACGAACLRLMFPLVLVLGGMSARAQGIQATDTAGGVTAYSLSWPNLQTAIDTA